MTPMVPDIFSKPIGTVEEAMRQARKPGGGAPMPANMLGGPQMPTENVGEVGPNPLAPPAPQAGPPPAALPMPMQPPMPEQRVNTPEPVAEAPRPVPGQDPREMLREAAKILLQGTPAQRIQGLQMMFEASQPLPAEQASAERDRLGGVIDTAEADPELRAQAKVLAQLGAKPETLAETLGFDAKGRAAKTAGKMKAAELLDKEYAQKYTEFKLTGAADSVKNITQLQEAKKLIQTPGLPVSGNVAGNLPDWMLSLTKEGEKAVAVKEVIQDVVQRSVKSILGAQYTQKEGEMLMARAFNPRLSEEENIARVNRLLGSLETAYSDQREAAQYFEENGTLAGFKGRALPTIQQLEDAVEGRTERGNSQRPGATAPKMSPQALQEKARAAIAAGKDPAAVAARMRELGVEMQ